MTSYKLAKFENAQELRRAFPDTFHAPTERECEFIQQGQFVKVCAGRERFWVKVTENDGGCLSGTVNNDLVLTSEHGLVDGDLVCIGYDEVYDIL